MRGFGLLSAVLVVMLAVPAAAQQAGELPPPPDQGNKEGEEAAVLRTDDPDAIPGRYVVVFGKGTPRREVASAASDARRQGAQILHTYDRALKGFAAALPQQALDDLRSNPRVAYIEADLAVTPSVVQSPATWGLDRSDQRNLPLDNAYTYLATGAGVTAYVIDTGILRTHVDFGGRAVHGYSAISDGRGSTDCNGHGTHVAGTVGGTTYGIAKSVTLVAVRVLGCTGSGATSGVIAGVDWVTANHNAPAVANMSLGGPASTSLDNAVANSVAAGVTYAVAAGNDNRDACNYSPARVSSALTVGSTTSSDARSSFSNFGTCVDLFAPGSSITSAWHTSTTATNTISGTSMASPHVAGVAALHLQGNPSATPATVGAAVLAGATSGVVSGVGSGSPNLLLYALLGGGGTQPSPDPDPELPCAYDEVHAGSLSGTGDEEFHPNGTYFYSGSGTHRGCLIGPDNADFDLFLWKWNGFSWVTVAQGVSATSIEDVSYTGTSGYYAWRVLSYSGSGAYDFSMQRP